MHGETIKFIIFILSKKCSYRFFSPPSRLCNEYRFFSPELKRPGLRVDPLPPSGAKVKNEWLYTYAPPVCHHGVHMDSFTFNYVLPILVNSRPTL